MQKRLEQRLERLSRLQESLAKRLVLKDSFGKLKLVAGCDQAFINNKIVSAIVVCDFKNMAVVEKCYSISKSRLPYVPGFLAFREGPAIIKTFRKLNTKPDILLVDGHGIIHPRKMGLACYVGLILNIPTIGVGKRPFVGEAKGNKVYVGGEVRGYVLKAKTRKSIYVSPGNKVSVSTSAKIVRNCMDDYSLPVPLQLSHEYANDIKRKIANE